MASRIPFLCSVHKRISKVIIGGDLNFTISHDNIWVCNARLDKEAIHFKHTLEESGFIDFEPQKHVSTWRNNRGMECVAKNMDILLVFQRIINEVDRIKYWVAPILL